MSGLLTVVGISLRPSLPPRWQMLIPARAHVVLKDFQLFREDHQTV